MAPITTATTPVNMRIFSSTSSQGSIAIPFPPCTSSPFPSTPQPRIALQQLPSNVKSTTSPVRTRKSATVTMMLAERIIRNDWSVEDEHFFESNNMNVWQTLEFLSGLNSRKRYNYEGYNDAKTALRTLTPSWRRDSFIEKSVNPNADESSKTTNGKYATVANSTAATASNENPDNNLRAGSAGDNGQRLSGGRTKSSNNKSANSSRRRCRGKQKNLVKELDPEYALSPADYVDLIKCTFNSPRISAALERLMGTNVVRLTDRNYMKELRERIEDDYRANLQKRIKARELKEVERERILIIEGKTNVIPAELADDPIFVVDKKADLEILKTRAKLKTNREKNSERLKLQGVKWERERLQHEEEEAQHMNVLRQRYREQKALEEQYKNEDADNGLDLLRIDNEDWRPCEKELKEFLEQERGKMKERSLRMPTPFTTDPKDINSILKARKDFRDVERRIRKTLEDSHKEQQPQQQQQLVFPTSTQSQDPIIHQTSTNLNENATNTNDQGAKVLFAPENADALHKHENSSSDDASVTSSVESLNDGSTISESKHRYAQVLKQELEHDVAEGLIISKDQYDHLRYEDEKIMQLKNARDIRELYQLAEDIIIGERIENYADEEEECHEAEEDGEDDQIAEH